MVKAVGKKIQKNYKRVRDTSLWKFMHSRRQSVNGKFRLCPDTGSACYSCTEFVTSIVIPNKKLYRNDKQHIVFARFSYHLFGITFLFISKKPD